MMRILGQNQTEEELDMISKIKTNDSVEELKEVFHVFNKGQKTRNQRRLTDKDIGKMICEVNSYGRSTARSS
uniref:Uncharacterized protein n=1 Tax=Oryza meridionalis TaxID=40149 RepID=A0A0E0F761_9ORYZ